MEAPLVRGTDSSGPDSICEFWDFQNRSIVVADVPVGGRFLGDEVCLDGTWHQVLKWKPSQFNTIDVVVRLNNLGDVDGHRCGNIHTFSDMTRHVGGVRLSRYSVWVLLVHAYVQASSSKEYFCTKWILSGSESSQCTALTIRATGNPSMF